MNTERTKRLLKQKENIHIEFKEAGTALPGNLFESICAMLNRDGGDILLGAHFNNRAKSSKNFDICPAVANSQNIN